LVAAASLAACNSAQPTSARSSQPPARAGEASVTADQATCQHLADSNELGSGPVSVAKVVGGSVAGIRYWLRNRPGAGSDLIRGFPDTAHTTVCVYHGWFPVPVPPGVPEPTGARYIVNPAGAAAMDSAGPIASMLASTPSAFPPVPHPASS
jgi:hypothetical protein